MQDSTLIFVFKITNTFLHYLDFHTLWVNERAAVLMTKASDHASAIPKLRTKWRAALYLTVLAVYF
jgi:hypothetical protein